MRHRHAGHVVADHPALVEDQHAVEVGDQVEVVARLPQQVVLVTHHLDLVADFDRVLVFDEGRVVCDDVPGVAVAHYRSLMGATP